LLHVISDLSIGGAEMMLYKMLAATDRSRFEPAVISLVNRGTLRTRIEDLDIPVHSANFPPGVPSALGFWRLVRLMRKLEPDLVMGWMYHSCLAAQLAGFFLLRRPAVLWSIHLASYSRSSVKKLTAGVIKLCAPLSKLAGQLIFVSNAGRAQHQRLGYNVARSCVIPNGIDTSEFIPAPESRSSVLSELDLPDDAVLIGMMARYDSMKDHANFLKAAAIVAGDYPEAHFVLIGQRVDQANADLCRLIRELGLTNRTSLLGVRYDVPRLSASLDIFSLSSSCNESFPNVIGEAMACEVPCAVTDVGDAAQIVGETGRVVPASNPRALAAAWKELIQLGTAGRTALGRAARARVIDRFRLESVVSRYETLYRTIAVERTRSDFASHHTLESNLHDSAAQ
jgi:glycosyltransferase involved in cell wall biosynthesis